MITLSYGYKLPETNDKGSTFFPALEDNIQRVNDHDHEGTNSKLLSTVSITTSKQNILPAAWVDQGGGTYKQTVSMNAGIDYDQRNINFKAVNGPTGIIYPTCKRVSNTSYDVYVNDNTLQLLAIYT